MFGSQAHDHGLGIKPVSDVCFCDMTVNMSPTNYNDSKLDWKKDRHFYATSSLRLFILKNTFSFAENEISGFFNTLPLLWILGFHSRLLVTGPCLCSQIVFKIKILDSRLIKITKDFSLKYPILTFRSKSWNSSPCFSDYDLRVVTTRLYWLLLRKESCGTDCVIHSVYLL